MSHRFESLVYLIFVEGIHFILTNPNSPNIVITPPQEENEVLAPPNGTVKKDQLLLYPFRYIPYRPRATSTLKLHRILTDEEFEEEEKYLYHEGISTSNDLHGPPLPSPQDEKHIIKEFSAADEDVDEEEKYLYG